jgi:hypothetical protein
LLLVPNHIPDEAHSDQDHTIWNFSNCDKFLTQAS